MLLRSQRFVQFYDSIIKVPDHDEILLDVPSLLKDVANLRSTNRIYPATERSSQTEQITIPIVDIDERNMIVRCLIVFASKDASDPAFKNLETGAIRMAGRQLGEGVAISAHMLISLKPLRNQPDRRLVIVEDVPGIGISRIQPLFRSCFQKAQTYSGTNRINARREVWADLQLSRHCNLKLGQILGRESSKILGVEVIDSNPSRPALDTEPSYTIVRKELYIKVDQDATQIRRILSLIRERFIRRDSYDTLRLRITSEKRSQKLDIDLRATDLMESALTRTERIPLSNPIEQCQQAFHDELLKKMTGILKNERSRLDGNL